MNREELTKLITEIIRDEMQLYLHQYNHIDESETLEAEWKLLNELILDIDNTYPIDKENSSKNIKAFYDDLNRLNLIKAKENNGSIEIKFYWLKNVNGTLIPSYDDPPNTSAKTFNTYLKIFLEYFINMGDSFVLLPTDTIKQRLYRIALNKLLDKNMWKIVDRQDKLELIIIKKS